MFEKRLKIILLILFIFTGVLLLRAMQVQIFDRNYWRERADQTMERSQLLETTRGRLLDFKGREMAVDAACIDACVDYRAIRRDPDPVWLREKARERLRLKFGKSYADASREQRAEMLNAEIELVKTDLEIMWATLARVSGKSVEEIEEIRRGIAYRVEMRRRYVWYHNYERARREHESREPSPWYRQWLIDQTQDAPQLDSFDVKVAEQTDVHVILRAIDAKTNNELGKNIEKYPGLVLQPSTHRYYPYQEAGCHLLGSLSRISKTDTENDPNVGNELRAYFPNDLIGRTGLEKLCEPKLRGTRGQLKRVIGEDRVTGRVDPMPGGDVRSTIDIELQRELQSLFRAARVKNPDNTSDVHEMHGAAVVIDVPTGQVRALASYPTFDLNEFDELYSTLVKDHINQPLLNRATQYPLVPGSTVKPIVGLGAIAQGLVKTDEGIECTGYLTIGGRKYDVGRCWVASKFIDKLGKDNVKHHPVPWDAPHPTGWLTFAEAIERSCNVYFEIMADRMKIEGLAHWMDLFGLGRPTGIGIAESPGRLPTAFRGPTYLRRMTAWFASIGQGEIAATPIQMANVAATIARDGMWVRPTLLVDSPGERVDLKLPPDAVAAARDGMIRVVNSKAGTGQELKHDDILIAGKTGTAQASTFSIIERDERGQPLRDENNRVIRKFLEPYTKAKPTSTPWYRGTGASGTELNHAWFIGFAPAKDPQIAFAVLVEYGGSGGFAAAGVAWDVLDACAAHGYLSTKSGMTKSQ